MKEEYELDLGGKMEMVRMSIRAVTRGYKMSRLITGIPGIGKSRAILNELEKEEVNFVHISGGVKNARALFMQLWDKNDPDLILFFDDTNDIFTTKESREVLRVAVTNQKIRNITYTDNVLTKEKFKYTSPLPFTSKIIIATNIPKKKIDSAIISRTNAIEVTASKEEVFGYIKNNIKAAPPAEIDLKIKMEVVDFLENEIGLRYITAMDFRVFEDCVLWRCAKNDESDGNDWKSWIKTVVTS